MIGVVAGLLDAGLDVTGADLVVGTSAGSTAAAQITGAALAELLAATVAAHPPPAPPAAGARPAGPVVDHLQRTDAIIAAAADAADMRRRMGAAALDLDGASDGSRSARWRAVVAARLPSLDWPERRCCITAVDARTGEPVVFDRDSGVDLVDAVAASCSSGFAYAIGDDRYIDGGYRRNENADLAAGTSGCWCCRRSAAGRGTRRSGACSSRRRSTSCARPAAGSRRSSRTSDCRAPVRRQRDGPVAASARRSRRSRARRRAGRADRRALALTSGARAPGASASATEGAVSSAPAASSSSASCVVVMPITRAPAASAGGDAGGRVLEDDARAGSTPSSVRREPVALGVGLAARHAVGGHQDVRHAQRGGAPAARARARPGRRSRSRPAGRGAAEQARARPAAASPAARRCPSA